MHIHSHLSLEFICFLRKKKVKIKKKKSFGLKKKPRLNKKVLFRKIYI